MLDSVGTLTWDGGGGHKGFIRIGIGSSGKLLAPTDVGGRESAFALRSDGRTIVFGANSDEEAKEWVIIFNDLRTPSTDDRGETDKGGIEEGLRNAAKPIADWNVDEVANWLRDVMELNDIATAATEAEIDGAEVVELDKECWKDLGATPIKAAKLVAAVKKLP